MMSQKQTFGLPKLKKKYRRALKISESFLKLVCGVVIFLVNYIRIPAQTFFIKVQK